MIAEPFAAIRPTAQSGQAAWFSDDGRLWTTDGSPTGTAEVPQLPPGELTDDFAAIGTTLFALTADGLWAIRDPSAGWTRIALPAGYKSSIAVVDDLLYFTSLEVGLGVTAASWALWRSDGTSTGTAMVAEQHPPVELLPGLFPSRPVAVAHHVFHSAVDDAGRWSLWSYDVGTGASEEVATSAPPLCHCIVAEMICVVSCDAVHGFEQLATANGWLVFPLAGRLWRSDGTATGTEAIADTGEDAFTAHADLNGVALLAAPAQDLQHIRLWRTDGTASGTAIGGDLPGQGVSRLVGAADRLFMVVRALPDGELWGLDVPCGDPRRAPYDEAICQVARLPSVLSCGPDTGAPRVRLRRRRLTRIEAMLGRAHRGDARRARRLVRHADATLRKLEHRIEGRWGRTTLGVECAARLGEQLGLRRRLIRSLVP